MEKLHEPAMRAMRACMQRSGSISVNRVRSAHIKTISKSNVQRPKPYVWFEPTIHVPACDRIECAEMKFFSFLIRLGDNFVAQKNRIEKNVFFGTLIPLSLMGPTPGCEWNDLKWTKVCKWNARSERFNFVKNWREIIIAHHIHCR